MAVVVLSHDILGVVSYAGGLSDGTGTLSTSLTLGIAASLRWREGRGGRCGIKLKGQGQDMMITNAAVSHDKESILH